MTGADALAKDDSGDRVLDLVAQTPTAADRPAEVLLSVADRDAAEGATLRIRLYEPVSTRAELWAATSGTPDGSVTSSWTVQELRLGAADDGAALVSVPVELPEDSSDRGLAPPTVHGPRPLHIELLGPDDAVIDTLRTFLIPPTADGAAGSSPMAVAVVVDLRTPPAHRPDGSAHIDRESLSRVLALAGVVTDRAGLPLTVDMSAETLDALNLIGDNASAAALKAALDGRQLLVSPWTSLDVDDWIEAGRPDVVIDGLQRSRRTLRLLGLEASTVMRFDGTPSPAAAALVSDSPAAVSGYLADRLFNTTTASRPLVPVAVLDDAEGRSHPMAQADPLLEASLRNDDPQLGVQRAMAELSRMAGAAAGPRSVVVVVSALATDWNADPEGGPPRAGVLPAAQPEALALLLDRLDHHPATKLVTVDDVLSRSAPARVAFPCCAAGTPTDPADFGRYLARRTEVESRLDAYESFIGLDGRDTAADPLRALLAASASPYLAGVDRIGLLDAVARQATDRVSRVDFIPRGRISITESSADLPVTVVNSRDAPVTVAVVLDADGVDFPNGARSVLDLQPGRNDLSIPIEVTGSGTAAIRVTITTPDGAGTITLSEGSLAVRRADASGLGLLVSVGAALALAVWWLRASRRSSHASRSDGDTVAA